MVAPLLPAVPSDRSGQQRAERLGWRARHTAVVVVCDPWPACAVEDLDGVWQLVACRADGFAASWTDAVFLDEPASCQTPSRSSTARRPGVTDYHNRWYVALANPVALPVAGPNGSDGTAGSRGATIEFGRAAAPAAAQPPPWVGSSISLRWMAQLSVIQQEQQKRSRTESSR